MSSTNLPDAIAGFMLRVVESGYRGAIRTLSTILRDGPPGRRKSIRWQQMHDWYISLAPKDRHMLDAVIAETARASVFGVLVLLDNKTGGYPLKPDLSDYAVYVQRYLAQTDFAHNHSASSMRINHSQAGEDLHDLLEEPSS